MSAAEDEGDDESVGRFSCSLSGEPYAPGSAADHVHRFLEAQGDAEVYRALQVLFQGDFYPGGTLEELSGHSLAVLTTADSDDQRAKVQARFLSYGNTLLANGYAVEASEVFSRLYPLIRETEITSHRRWHKGDAFFFLARAFLMTGQVQRAEQFQLLALLEDCWQHAEGGDAPEKLPAYRFLANDLHLPRETLDDVLAAMESAVSRTGEWTPSEPERTYLLSLCRRELWVRDRPPMPFVLKVASQLLVDVERKGASADEKGTALEILVAYLFETAGGFRAVLRARGADSESDLIILNLHSDRPLSMLGDHLLVSCKNTIDKADAGTVRDLIARLAEAECKCGILVSVEGFTGDEFDGAMRTVTKADRLILTIDGVALKRLATGQAALESVLVDRFTARKFDLR